MLDAATGKPVPDLRVTVTGLQRDGDRQVQEDVRTDGRGRFAFPGLPAGSGRLYGLHVRYRGGLFVEAPVALPSSAPRRPQEANLAVWPTTTDPSTIRLSSDRMFVLPGRQGRVGVLEFVSIVNSSDQAYAGRARAMAPEAEGPAPSLAFYLPAGGSDVSLQDSSFVIPELRPSPFGFAITVAVPPGEHDLTYAYGLEGTAGTYELSRVALYPIEEYSIFVEESLSLESDRLQDEGMVTIRGDRYREWSTADGFDAGDRIQAAVTRQAGADPVLIGGLVALAVLILGMLTVALLRRRARPVVRPARRAPSPREDKEDLIERIAELDIRRDNGELSEDQWESQRTALKQRLARLEERAS